MATNPNNNINRALNGLNPLSYMGINATGSLSASQTIVNYYAPTPNDSKNFIIGCIWLWPDTDMPVHLAQIWMLTALLGNEATWTELEAGAATGIITINGDSGFITGPIVGITGNTTAGSSVGFVGNDLTAMTFNVTDIDGNTLIGLNAGNDTLSGTNNTGLGQSSLNALTSGSANVSIGSGTGPLLTSGTQNTLVGAGAGVALLTGNGNLALGFGAASSYTGAESTNIIIGNTGVIGDSHVTRIGTGGGQTKCFIAGIDGVNVGSVARVVTEASNQLGTAILTAGAGVTITPGANTITIAATGGQAIDRINGDSTTFVTGSTVSLTGLSTAGSSVAFIGNDLTAMVLDTTDANENTLIGAAAGNNTLSGTNNTGLGFTSLHALTTGLQNSALGMNTLKSITTGANNIAVGYNAASNYTTSESSNIIIGNTGTVSESHILRIGTNGSGAGQQNKCFIAGIDGVNVGNVATVVTEASNQLGTAVLTAGSNITITPTANTITIAATGGGGGFSSPVFSAYLASSQATNTAGPSSTYQLGTLQALTVLSNVGSAFYAGDGVNAPATFTAPATGVYSFIFNATAAAVMGALPNVIIITPSNSFMSQNWNFQGNSMPVPVWCHCVAPLTSADVVTFATFGTLTVYGTTTWTGGSPSAITTSVYGFRVA